MTSILLLGSVASPSPSAAAFGAGVINFSFLLSVMVWAPLLMAFVVAGLPARRGLYGRTELADVARNTALSTNVALLVLCLLGYIQFQAFTTGVLFEERLPWLPAIGAGYHLGLDGVGMTTLLLGSIIAVISVVASAGIRERPREYFCLLLVAQSAFNGVVVARDAFVLLLFWAASTVPIALLLAGWGGPNAGRAAVRYFAYASIGTIALALAALILYLGTGGSSFDIDFLARVPGTPRLQTAAGIALLVAAATRLPLFPLHGWIRDSLAEAATGVAIFIAGASSRLGAYLLIRLLIADLHDGARVLAPFIAGLGAATVIYGALLALRTDDIRRAAAYAALIPGGVVLLGIAGLTPLGLDGATLQIFSGGLAAALLVGAAATIALRAQTRSMGMLGGGAARMPRLTWAFVLGGLAVLGVPGFGTFVSQLMSLMGSFRAQPVAAAAVLVGLAIGAAAVAMLLYRVLFRPPNPDAPGIADATLNESWYLAVLAVVLLWVGVVPSGPKLAGQPIFDPGIVNVANAGAAQIAAPYVPGFTPNQAQVTTP